VSDLDPYCEVESKAWAVTLLPSADCLATLQVLQVLVSDLDPYCEVESKAWAVTLLPSADCLATLQVLHLGKMSSCRLHAMAPPQMGTSENSLPLLAAVTQERIGAIPATASVDDNYTRGFRACRTCVVCEAVCEAIESMR